MEIVPPNMMLQWIKCNIINIKITRIHFYSSTYVQHRCRSKQEGARRTIGGKGQTFLKKIQSPKEDFLPTLSERYDMSAENPSCQCTNCVMSGDKYKHLI